VIAILAMLVSVGIRADQRVPPPKSQPAPIIEFFEVHELSILDLQSR
jgi:hypothetical protein